MPDKPRKTPEKKQDPKAKLKAARAALGGELAKAGLVPDGILDKLDAYLDAH